MRQRKSTAHKRYRSWLAALRVSIEARIQAFKGVRSVIYQSSLSCVDVDVVEPILGFIMFLLRCR